MALALAALQQAHPTVSGTQVIVLTPSRELAFQISAECARLGANSGISVHTAVGALASPLETTTHIVIGTPRMLFMFF